MGGYGSTRWSMHTKRETVENCLTLSVRDLVKIGALRRGQRWSGSVRWSVGSATTATVSAIVDAAESDGQVWLIYSVSGRPVSLKVQLTTFAPQRWLFVCPLCGEQRAAKLYKPPRADRFGCRVCHDLTYKSSQESDKRVSRLKRLTPDQLADGMRSGQVDYLLGLKASMSHIDRLMRLGGL